ncbi:hypothetical protein [Methylosinus sp. RM1]|uniref:hypothetical protein n=1 Tax=Methylosinus sp. RM1 TaxID=2583817 RepID=UPI001408E922|nr:hypothetical protein [Methylosinus sp. RM1]
MSALTIDTLAVSQILSKRGFSEEQATGVVEALREIDGSLLTTKSDLKAAVADVKVDILRWLVVTQLALGGFIFAAIKFMR